jgi:hypothetical protein
MIADWFAKTNRIGSMFDLFGKWFRWLIRNVKNELSGLSLIPVEGDKFFLNASGLVEFKSVLKF